MSIFRETCTALGTFFNKLGEVPKKKDCLGGISYSDGAYEELLRRPTPDNPNRLCVLRQGREVPLKEAMEQTHAANIARRTSLAESITVRGPLRLRER